MFTQCFAKIMISIKTLAVDRAHSQMNTSSFDGIVSLLLCLRVLSTVFSNASDRWNKNGTNIMRLLLRGLFLNVDSEM